jgi:hypothetical protein
VRVPALDLCGNQPLDLMDGGFVTSVERPLLDAFGTNEARLHQNLHVHAGRGLADAQFFGDEDTANAVLHQIAIRLRAEMLPGVLQPGEDPKPAIVRDGPECQPKIHIDN